jgi:hypothetical protein
MFKPKKCKDSWETIIEEPKNSDIEMRDKQSDHMTMHIGDVDKKHMAR